MPTYAYGPTIADILTNAVDIDSHVFQAMLIGSGYTPNFDTDHFVSAVRANEVAASGSYVANGYTLNAGQLTVAYTAASSATARANSTAYSVGEIVRPATSNGHVWRCTAAGTTGASEPAAMTTFSGNPGQTVTDGTVTWAECGRGYVKIGTPANVQWTSATIAARYMVIADFNPSTDATRQLLACLDFGSVQNSTNGTFTVAFDPEGLLLLALP